MQSASMAKGYFHPGRKINVRGMRFYAKIIACCIIISAAFSLMWLPFFQLYFTSRLEKMPMSTIFERYRLQKAFKFIERTLTPNVKILNSQDYSENYNDYWRCVDKANCVYSAYWDHRFNPPFVRLIGATSVKTNVTSWKCLLKYNRTTTLESPVTLEKMPDSHKKPKTAAFFFCAAASKPKEVELVIGNARASIAVQGIEFKLEEKKKRFAVCIRPLYGKLSNLAIAEFIAFYQILGANHFTFYDYGAGGSIKRLFLSLLQSGVSLVLLPWNLPKAVEGTWASAQYSSIADCIYRNSRDYEFVAIVDIDEYIMPRRDKTLQELIEGISEPHANFSTYMFRQSFFCMEAKNDPISANLSIPLITQTKTRQDKMIYPKRRRSKCIVRPAAITTPGIHFTWSELNSWKTLIVDPGAALLHHYRAGLCSVSKGKSDVLERRALRYRKRILESTPIKVWSKLNIYHK